MKRNRLPLAIALAACSFTLPAISADNTVWLQLTPAGEFRPSDGRQMVVPSWRIDQAIATKVIERFRQKKTPPVVDYEHQTLLKEQNGQPAPAAGFIRDMQWRDGQGLFAQVELTARAAQYIADGEYRYFSPVFLFSPSTGDVLDVRMGALTNDPAVDGMQEISLRAAATFGLSLDDEDHDVNPLLKALLAALGLPETTTEDKALAALTARMQNYTELRKLLGVEASATDEAVLAACTGIKAKAAAGNPDPAKFVGIEVIDQLKGQVAVLTANIAARDQADTDALINAALEDGRLLKPMEQWARELGKKDRAALTAYLDAAAPIAALAGSQTRGKNPEPDAKTGLTAEEMAVCTAMGITPDQFKAAKPAAE